LAFMALLSFCDSDGELTWLEDDCPAPVAVSDELHSPGGNHIRPVQHTERNIFPSVVGKDFRHGPERYLVGLSLGW
jgi:hypothetical protein